VSASQSPVSWPGEPSPPPQLTGDWEADTVVDAYRLYYANDKRDLFAWTKRQPPPWLDDYRREEPAADTDP